MCYNDTAGHKSVVKKNTQIGLGAVPYTCTAKLRSHPYCMVAWPLDSTDTVGIRPYIRKIRGMLKVGRCIIDFVLDTTVGTYTLNKLTLPHANLNLCLTFMNIHMVVAFKVAERVRNTATVYTAHTTTAWSPMIMLELIMIRWSAHWWVSYLGAIHFRGLRLTHHYSSRAWAASICS
jgi:hypothetical protein